MRDIIEPLAYEGLFEELFDNDEKFLGYVLSEGQALLLGHEMNERYGWNASYPLLQPCGICQDAAGLSCLA